jgi:hypothetical protein
MVNNEIPQRRHHLPLELANPEVQMNSGLMGPERFRDIVNHLTADQGPVGGRTLGGAVL